MTARKGFTLIELLVVIFIIGVLAAVAAWNMRGRIEVAKWAEGRAAAVSIRTAARTFCAEKGPKFKDWSKMDLGTLGFRKEDLDGKYFTYDCYKIQFNGYDNYVITVTAADSRSAEKPALPAVVTLNQAGNWVEK